VKASVKRLLDTLEALGFVREPHPYKRGHTVHHHVNDIDQVIKVWGGMSDAAATAACAKANKIADTGHVGPAMPTTVRDRSEAKERARRVAEAAAVRKRAVDKEAEHQAAQERARLRRLASDRMTVGDRLYILEQIGPGFFSVDRLADELGMKARTLHEAIAREDLDLYQVGREQKLKVEDVARWLTLTAVR